MLAGKMKRFAKLLADAIEKNEDYVAYKLALEAGYAENGARVTASRLVRNKHVIKYLDRRQKGLSDEMPTAQDSAAKKAEKREKPASAQPKISEAESPVPVIKESHPEACDLPSMPEASNEDYAVSILRVQLHSDDERIAQGAARTLLDYEIKKRTASGVKATKDQQAKQAAEVSRFKPRAVQ